MIIHQFINVKTAICKYTGHGAIYILGAVLLQKKKKKEFHIYQIIHSQLTTYHHINRLTHHVE